MPAITDHIRLYIYDKQNFEVTNEYYEFQVNPSSIEVTNEMTTVISSFLRQDGGIVRPTQKKLRTIKGSGKFFDIPSSINGNNTRYNNSDTQSNPNTVLYNSDSFPLISGSPYTSAFDMYKALVKLMEDKQLLRFDHQYIGQIYVYIQSINLTNTISENTVDFSFSLIETLIDTKSGTGFEVDANQQVPGQAISASSSTLQFFEYKTKAGDTLARLALKFFGSASKYGLILDYNENITTNPSSPLYPPSLTLNILKTTSAPMKKTGGVTPKTTQTITQVGVGDLIINGIKNGLNNLFSDTTQVAPTIQDVKNISNKIFNTTNKIFSNLQKKVK